jgi:hypothetical protein
MRKEIESKTMTSAPATSRRHSIAVTPMHEARIQDNLSTKRHRTLAAGAIKSAAFQTIDGAHKAGVHKTSKATTFASKLASELTDFYSQDNGPSDKDNIDWSNTNYANAGDGHFTKAMARKQKGVLSLGISFWSGYGNQFMIIECTGSDTLQFVLDKCLEQTGFKPRIGDAVQLFSQKEFERPNHKKSLAQHIPNQMPGKSGMVTLAEINIKDGEMLHVLPARAWKFRKPSNMK